MTADQDASVRVYLNVGALDASIIATAYPVANARMYLNIGAVLPFNLVARQPTGWGLVLDPGTDQQPISPDAASRLYLNVTPQVFAPIAPASISGLVGWYSAQYEAANFADGATMAQWTDLSGLGHHAVGSGGSSNPVWRSSGGPGGGARITFGVAGSKFYIPATGFWGGTPTAVEMAASVQVTATTNQSRWMRCYTSTNDVNCFYTYSDGLIYDNFATTGRKNNISPGVSVTSWHRYAAYSAPSDWAAFHNGVSSYSTTSNTVSIQSTGNIVVGGDDNGSLAGSQSALLLYNRKLTTGERGGLDAWLAANPAGGTP